MIKTTRCPNNHYYDMEKFSKCPYCGAQGVSVPVPQQAAATASEEKKAAEPKKEAVRKYPLAGWLACVKGPSVGKVFPVRDYRNFIGSSDKMDIAIKNDDMIARDRHAVITYEPVKRVFLAQEGSSRELYYLNDEAVLENKTLKSYDRIKIGNSEFVFVGLCGDKFSWNDYPKEK